MFLSFFKRYRLNRLSERCFNNKNISHSVAELVLFVEGLNYRRAGVRAMKQKTVITRYHTIKDLSDKVRDYIALLESDSETFSELFTNVDKKKTVTMNRWLTEDGYEYDENEAWQLLIETTKSLLSAMRTKAAHDDGLYTFYETAARSLLKELSQTLTCLASIQFERGFS